MCHALVVSVKATKNSTGPAVLVPSQLVLGVTPSLPVIPKGLPKKVIRIKSLMKARNEMARLTIQQRLITKLKINVPVSAGIALKILEEILMFREKPIGK